MLPCVLTVEMDWRQLFSWTVICNKFSLRGEGGRGGVKGVGAYKFGCLNHPALFTCLRKREKDGKRALDASRMLFPAGRKRFISADGASSHAASTLCLTIRRVTNASLCVLVCVWRLCGGLNNGGQA